MTYPRRSSHRCAGSDCSFCEELADMRAYEAELLDDEAADRRADIEEDRRVRGWP